MLNFRLHNLQTTVVSSDCGACGAYHFSAPAEFLADCLYFPRLQTAKDLDDLIGCRLRCRCQWIRKTAFSPGVDDVQGAAPQSIS